MQKVTFYILSLIFICIISCKTDTKNLEKKTEKLSFSDSIAASGHMKETKPQTKDELSAFRQQAESILAFRIKEKPKTWAILDVGLWEYEFVFKDGAMSKAGEYNGKWIDFDEKNNYQYGSYSTIEGKGSYHYDGDSHLLLLVDESEAILPQEFELKLLNGFMIAMGKNTFGPNAMQAKLKKIQNIPSK